MHEKRKNQQKKKFRAAATSGVIFKKWKSLRNSPKQGKKANNLIERGASFFLLFMFLCFYVFFFFHLLRRMIGTPGAPGGECILRRRAGTDAGAHAVRHIQSGLCAGLFRRP
jgi:hypothetical protein